MPKEQWQTRLDSDMADQVEEYQDEHNLTSAEAVRRLVAGGIEQQEEPTRGEIAADLRRINESVEQVADDLDDLRADLDGTDADDQEMATARMNQTARQSGSILMLLLLGFLAAAEVGLL